MSDDVAAQVRRHLAEIPELLVEAGHYLTPGSAPLDPNFKAQGKGSVYKIPIVPEILDLLDTNDKALDDVMLSRRYLGFLNAERDDFNINNGQRRLGVLPTLGLWVSLVYAEFEDLGQDVRECCPSRQHTIVGECDWLSEYAEGIIELHSDFPRDIEQLWLELRKACRIRKEYVPRCPAHGGVNRIEGVYGSPEDAAPAWWRCTGCGKTWVHDAEIRRLALTQPRMTLRQIGVWLNIPLRTLHNWRTAGRFSGDSRGLYEVEHIKRAADAVGRVTA